MKTIAIALLLMTLELAQAEPRHSERNPNYILRRQEAGLVTGTPISSLRQLHARARRGPLIRRRLRVAALSTSLSTDEIF